MYSCALCCPNSEVVWIWIADVVLSPIFRMGAEPFHDASVAAPVLWPGDHVVLARVVDAADGLAAFISGATALRLSVSSQN